MYSRLLTRYLILFITGSLLVVACAPDRDQEKQYVFELDINKPDQRLILDLQDRSVSDSLAVYLTHPDPSLRYRAAMAFASTRDSTAVHLLGKLLRDENANVRYAAAYALGQTGSGQAEQILIKGFDGRDSLRQFDRSNAAILEAVGKTGSEKSLAFLSTIETYRAEDSVLILGQARGIYRFALRGMVTEKGTAVMVDLLESGHLSRSIRLIAANYLFRAPQLKLESSLPTLTPLFRNESNPDIRACLAMAIGRTTEAKALQNLKSQFFRESDYRVKCNILRALRYFPYEQTHDFALGAVRDQNLHVAITAAEHVAKYGRPSDALEFRSLARGQLPWEVKSLLYEASNRLLSRQYAITKANIQNELEEWFRRSNNPYEKAAVLKAIGANPQYIEELKALGYNSSEPVIRATAVMVIAGLASDDNLGRLVDPAKLPEIRNRIGAYLMDAINSRDAAMIAEAANGLSSENMRDFTSANVSKLASALAQIELPGQIETYNTLARCIAAVKGEKFVPRRVQFNHPIDWNLVAELRDTVAVEILTNRGPVLLDLYTATAPGTVANFVQLAREKFYHGKRFHRVVPNFVVQDGCPRGDGYGSLDYTIRSELGPKYYDHEGVVGMASAGNDTECTQWFITHCPTPHLDGNYTIFGKVRSGMRVIHELQIGDEVREVNVIN